MSDLVRVAVDAMGGDYAPVEPVKGAVEAVNADERVKVQLVGQVDVIEKERYDQIVISSTYIRDVLSQGNVTLAAELLGYRYGVTGIVRHGRQLGRTLGFPTMNVEPEEKKILPRFGVYVCRINIDGKWYNGIGNVGVKPTVTEEHKRLVEVFVYDYEGDSDRQVDECREYSVSDLFCCGYARYFWEAVKIRYPEYCFYRDWEDSYAEG